MISQTTKHLTDASILDEMKRVAQFVGSPHLTQDVFKKNSMIHPTTIFRRFGSWRKACCEAGLDLSPRTYRYSDLECFENLLKLWTYYGRPPVGREAEILPSTVGIKAYLNRWGTWRGTLTAFVLWANSSDAQLQGTVVADGETLCEVPARANEIGITRIWKDPRAISGGTRYRVLIRDNCRCVICGASPATQHGCVLHLDHILPVSKGGTADIDNLRVLCAQCNLGKGANIEIQIIKQSGEHSNENLGGR